MTVAWVKMERHHSRVKGMHLEQAMIFSNGMMNALLVRLALHVGLFFLPFSYDDHYPPTSLPSSVAHPLDQSKVVRQFASNPP